MIGSSWAAVVVVVFVVFVVAVAVAANAAVAEHVERMTRDAEVTPDSGLQLQQLQSHLSEQEAAFRIELDKLPTEMSSQRRTLEGELAVAIANAEASAQAARVRERQSATDAAARLMDRYFDESEVDEYQDQSGRMEPAPTTETAAEPELEPEPEPEPEGSNFVFEAVFSKEAELGLTWACMTVDGHDDDMPVIQHVEAGSAADEHGCARGMVLGAVSGVAIGVIGGFGEIMNLLSTTRPITLQMIASIDIDKSMQHSTQHEFKDSYG